MENKAASIAVTWKIGPLILMGCIMSFHPVFSQEEKPAITYPKIQGYFAVFHPIGGYNVPTNFKDNYVVGFPIGINIFKNAKVGYSFELFPFIQADSEGSKMSK